ncbi:right-handed parallel beta-helix repeat-containing protein [Brevundimonas sp. S30B]|nr:right-handed parallel beta-helix repeat-containing protein [Brevundimonas sp. MF30-B]TFW01410.1 right-handed parallel beta-helix repeat-containing protein [Brevundimonas sp. S30B]
MAIGLVLAAQAPPGTRDCSAQEIDALTAATDQPFALRCRARLGGRSVVRPVRIEGAEASGALLDCGGGSIGRPGQAVTTRSPTVAIWSRDLGDGRFSRPRGVALTDCTVHGAVRIWGMGAGESMVSLHAASRRPDHTARAQAAAPTDIALSRVTFAGTGSIPLYVGPGVTRVTVSDSRFTGRSVSTAVYLDAESADNTIRDSSFDLRTGREVIAVDGSARNRIMDNRIALNRMGGVFLYRNCGEDGVIRHQTPSDNRITGNTFTRAAWLVPRAVVVGSREGNRRYCGDDAGWPFGSSADDGDNAAGNVVAGNTVSRR